MNIDELIENFELLDDWKTNTVTLLIWATGWSRWMSSLKPRNGKCAVASLRFGCCRPGRGIKSISAGTAMP